MYSLIVQSLNPLCLCLGAAIAMWAYLLTRGATSRSKLGWLGLPLLLLAALATPLGSRVLASSLESGYQPRSNLPAETEAIVVLGGYLEHHQLSRAPAPCGTTLCRCMEAARLYHAGPSRPVVVCGGTTTPLDPETPLSAAMAEIMIALQVPADDVWQEDRSQSTYENAMYAAELLREHDIRQVAVVTDAAHLPRAMACFRQHGLDPAPCGCRFRSTPQPLAVADFLPHPNGLSATAYVVHEQVGLLWYRLSGRV